MKNDTLEIDQVKTSYAIIDRGDGKRCAWCEKLISEFKDIDEHIIIEDTLAKIESGYGNSEELLYDDFQKLKEEILKNE